MTQAVAVLSTALSRIDRTFVFQQDKEKDTIIQIIKQEKISSKRDRLTKSEAREGELRREKGGYVRGIALNRKESGPALSLWIRAGYLLGLYACAPACASHKDRQYSGRSVPCEPQSTSATVGAL